MAYKLEKYDIQKLESYWSNQKELLKELKFREDELGTTKDNDWKYQNLFRLIQTIQDIYTSLDDDVRHIVDMRYNERYNTWEDIAEQLFMSKTKVLRIRNKLLDLTAEKIGWI